MMFEIHTASGRVADNLVSVEPHPEKQQVHLVYRGVVPLVLARVVVEGRDMQSLVGKTLLPGAAIIVPRTGAQAFPGKVSAVGSVMRQGRVVRDVRTPESDAMDAGFEAGYAAVTKERLAALLKANATDDGLLAYLKARSYHGEVADALIAEVRAAIDQGSGS
jgi:hypothetical protein